MNGNRWGNYIRVDAKKWGNIEATDIDDLLPDVTHGWIALFPQYKFKIEKFLKYDDFSSVERRFKYYGQLGDVYVWDWTMR